jgi:hypothetical protein
LYIDNKESGDDKELRKPKSIFAMGIASVCHIELFERVVKFRY